MFSVANTQNYGNASRAGVYAYVLLEIPTLTLRRGYPLKKIQENNEAEIMGVVSEEARESYPPEIVVELQSESTDDLEANVARVVAWVEAWKKDHPAEDAEEL